MRDGHVSTYDALDATVVENVEPAVMGFELRELVAASKTKNLSSS